MSVRRFPATALSLAFFIASGLFAHGKPEESVSSSDNDLNSRLRDLGAGNSRLQQAVIRLRNRSLQTQASIRLREQVIGRYAQQTDSIATAQLDWIEWSVSSNLILFCSDV